MNSPAFRVCYMPSRRDDEDYDYQPPPEKRTQKVLGIEMSPLAATAVDGLVTLAQPRIVNYARLGIERFGRPALGKLFKTEAHINKGVDLLSHAATYGLTFYESALSASQYALDYRRDMSALNKSLASYNVANHEKSGFLGFLGSHSDNEVIRDARREIADRMKSGYVESAVKGLVKLPTLYASKLTEHVSALETHPEKVVSVLGEKNMTKDMVKGRIEFLNVAAPSISMLGNELSSQYVKKKPRAGDDGPVLEMIQHLGGQLEANPGSDSIETETGGSIKVSEYMRKIFNRQQRRSHQPEIGRHVDEPFGYACEAIADALIDGRISSDALIGMVGNREIILKPNGKKIADHETVDKVVAKYSSKMPPHSTITAEEYYKNAMLGQDETKTIMHGLKGYDLDLFVAMHPFEAMKAIGVKERDIQASGERAGPHLNKGSGQKFLVIASRPDDVLKTDGYSEEDRDYIQHTREQIEQKGGAREVRRIRQNPEERHKFEELVANDKKIWTTELKKSPPPLSRSRDEYEERSSRSYRTGSRHRSSYGSDREDDYDQPPHTHLPAGERDYGGAAWRDEGHYR